MKRILFIIFICCSQFIYSQTIVTDRPDQTEASSIIPLNSLQIEAGVLFQKTEGIQQNFYPTALWRYGISEIFELRLLTQYENNSINGATPSIGGLSDLEIGTKVQLFKKEGVNTEIAFLSHLIIPTAKNELTNDQLGTINKLSISHSLSKSASIGYNIGYNYFGFGSGNLTYSAALGFSLSEKIGFYVEPYGEFVDFNKHLASFDSGFTYLVNNNLQLDVSYGVGLNYQMNYFSTGFSWNIPKKKQ